MRTRRRRGPLKLDAPGQPFGPSTKTSRRQRATATLYRVVVSKWTGGTVTAVATGVVVRVITKQVGAS